MSEENRIIVVLNKANNIHEKYKATFLPSKEVIGLEVKTRKKEGETPARIS